MGQSSTFYYVASVYNGSRPPFYVPLAGVHFGTPPAGAWFSASVKTFNELKQNFERIDPTVKVYLSMPRIWAGVFYKTASFPEIAVLVYPPPKPANTVGGDSYMRGGHHVMTLPDLTVSDMLPIHGTKVPGYPPPLRSEVEKTLGVSAYHFICVHSSVGDSVYLTEGNF